MESLACYKEIPSIPWSSTVILDFLDKGQGISFYQPSTSNEILVRDKDLAWKRQGNALPRP